MENLLKSEEEIEEDERYYYMELGNEQGCLEHDIRYLEKTLKEKIERLNFVNSELERLD